MLKCSKVGVAEQVIKRLYSNPLQRVNTMHTASFVSKHPNSQENKQMCQQSSLAKQGTHGRAPVQTGSILEMEEATAYKRGNLETPSTQSQESQSSTAFET